jgi:hypothetical protein
MLKIPMALLVGEGEAALLLDNEGEEEVALPS